MSQLTMQPMAKFSCRDGEYRWACPRCSSVLGIVARGFRKPTIDEIRASVEQEFDNENEVELKFSVSVVELRAGYVWSEQKEMWIKPENPRGFNQGARKRDHRQFARGKIEDALTKGDVATVLDEQMKIERLKEKKLSTEKPVLFSADFPAVVKCHKIGCGTVAKIPAIKGVMV